jgi:ornithine carbamoyltransferase
MKEVTMTALRGRSYLAELDFTTEEVRALMDLSARLKAERAAEEHQRLAGLRIALVFEKSSTRTRCAFEVAAADQGAHTTYLGPQDSHLGHKESVRDTARVLGRMYDAIQYRGFAQETVEQLAEHSGVPVYNGLTDAWHPTQSLCDVFTMTEQLGKDPADLSYCFVGDTRNNVARSTMAMAAVLGADVRLAGPRSLWPDQEVVLACRARAAHSGGRITLTDDLEEAVAGVDVVHTDVWVSLGEPAETWDRRIGLLLPYQVSAKTLGASGNPDVRFMHCLPALHDTGTEVGRRVHDGYGLDALEVTDEVFESAASLVFDQAENRLHTIKAILVATLGS